MNLNEVRKKYLDFFSDKVRKHAIIPSASLVPENDPTTLFTGSGMQPLVPYLLGEPHPAGRRLVNSQKCFRSEDIDEVGDNRHTTFFEMLGNWSLGDYWKDEQLSWFFEFLTKELDIKKERLWVTCFEGDKNLGLPKDTESEEVWKKNGIPDEHIHFYGAKKNWWSRSGEPEHMPVGEPGGPDSEVFYDFGAELGLHEKSTLRDEKCHPNCDCGRFMEIGNSVFMEYQKTANGFQKLKQRNVDFGGGLERITAATNNEPDVIAVCHRAILDHIEKASGKTYGKNDKETKAFRIIADHMKASVFLVADNINPSNTDRGYFVRRLIRRAVRYADLLEIKHRTLAYAVQPVAEMYKKVYPKIDTQLEKVINIIIEEEAAFRKTLERGLKEFNWRARTFTNGVTNSQELPASIVFELVTTYGFPFELIKEIAQERGMTIDKQLFQNRMEAHRIKSRSGAVQKFKGGLADHSEKVIQYHTATHLLHQALRDVLGAHVGQKGSNITGERLRFDFTHPSKMTPVEIKKVEDIVNEKIGAELPVQKVVLPLSEAQKSGALHFFGEKYGEQVSIYYIGDNLKTAYSKEFCGGPHVSNTKELGGHFKIIKEEAVSAGIRRIKAVII